MKGVLVAVCRDWTFEKHFSRMAWEKKVIKLWNKTYEHERNCFLMCLSLVDDGLASLYGFGEP
jgi:hypothetical protein